MIKSFIIFLVFVCPLFAIAGGTVGNGGDGVSAEFVLTAQTAVELIKSSVVNDVKGFKMNAFIGAVATTKVNSADSLTLNGNEVDAINYPQEKKLVVNRSRWALLRSEDQTVPRFMLVLHEYLWLSGSDDSSYKISKTLIQRLSPSKFSTDKFWSPMNPTNAISVGFTSPGCGNGSGNWQLKFDVTKDDETQNLTILPDCDGHQRTIKTHKHTEYGVSSNGSGEIIKGSYHIFETEVFAEDGHSLGQITYTPEWGRCLVSSDDRCTQSGSLQIEHVTLEFDLVK